MLSRLRAIRFFAICVKTEGQRALKMLSVPTKLMIAVILNPILRYLRPSEAKIAFGGCREWASPSHVFSHAEKFSLLVVFDFT